MKIAYKIFLLMGFAMFGMLLLTSCEVIDTLNPGLDRLLNEEAVVDGGGGDDGGTVDGGTDDGGGDDGGDGFIEPIDCGEDPPCGMVPGERDLPCSAIDGGTCDQAGCCVPGVCRGPNQDFFEAIGRDCPQGADQDGCCIHGRSAEAPGHFCEEGPKCRDDHPSGLPMPCAAINGGTCEDGCCVAGPCKGPNEAFFKAIGLDGCPHGEVDQEGCCVPDSGGDDGGIDGGGDDGTDDGGTS